MSALSAALCRRGIILWLAAVLLLASRSTHSAPVYDQDTTQIAEYDGAVAGCYFNFQRYQEGDRIITSEPCLNCTCHNRMLMCYLKVCPFTKAIGQDCTVEKRPDQCCPVITCLEVPVQLLTSTMSAPADSTAVGFHDNYGCHVDERFYPDGAMLPLEHHNPCELCYCIRNRTTCVMQECTLQVAGCKPVYQPGVCCPIKYNCEYDEELSTTVGPTPGLITTTPPPGASSQCYHEDKVYEDGDLIYSNQPCEHCYCFRGEIACAVQNCGTPMQAHGKNCTALPPPEGECCPTTYECEEDEGITLPEEDEEQLPGQVPHDLLTTESPMLIDQEDQQVKKHLQEETFPGADNAIPHEGEEEGNIQGTIEHITQEHIASTEKSEEQPATPPAEENAVLETETTATEEAITTKVPSDAEATKTEAPMTVQKTEESLATEAPAVELPEVSSISEGLRPEEEAVTTEHVPEEHISTEESVVEKEQSIEPAVSEETQTESVKSGEITSPHEELSVEVTEAEKTTGEGQVSVTEAPERPEISTEIVEEATLPVIEAEQLDISTVPESITEKTKESEDKVETSSEILMTETEASIKEVTTTVPHEASSTEKITTEKEISHLTEIAVTEEVPLTEVSSLPTKQPAEKEQKPMVSEGEEEQRPEEPTSEHAVIEKEQATVGAKMGDAGLTESPAMGEEHITTEGQRAEESTPEIPTQGLTGIPIPERSPEQKAEDENVYHVTEDYHDIIRPEIISPDNLITEHPQEIPTTYIPQEQETTLASSEETSKPSAEEAEAPEEESSKPYPEEVTEINLPSQRKPEITTGSEETKTESTPAVTEAHASTEPSATTISHISGEKVSEETEKPSVPKEIETEIQSTEETLKEELPTKELGIKESGSFEQISGEKEVQPKKEQSNEEEIKTQPPIITEPEISTSIPAEHEHSTVPPSLEEEQTTKSEHITVIPEQSTVLQIGEIETEITPAEKKKPVEEHVTKQPAISPGITEEDNEIQTEEPTSKETETTVAIKTIEEAEEKPTTQAPVEKEKTEQPEQYSTDKISEEAATTESHGVQQTEAPPIEKKPEEAEGIEGVSTESIEHQTEAMITEKEPSEGDKPSEETIGVKPTDITSIEQTELPHPIETSEAEKESEEKISVPVSTEEVQTEIPVVETGSTESPAVEETEKIQTEPSVTEEYIPSQPSIPSDRKEDQESVEPKPSEEKQEGEEQVTQKPSLEEKKEIETHEEPQKTTIPSEEAVTESVLPEQKPTEVTGTTTLVDGGEAVTQPAVQEQPEVASAQPENVTTRPSEQEEQTQGPVIKEQPEIHVRKETETPISVIHEGTSVTPTSTGEEDISKSTEAASEGITTLGPIEKPTKHEGEVSVETEIIPSTESVSSELETVSSEEIQPEIVSSTESASSESESVPSEERQPEIISSTESTSLESSKSESVSLEERQPETHEQTTQSLVMEEESSQEGSEELTEIPTKESAIPEMPKVPVTEEQPQKPEVKDIASTEPPIHEEQEEHATVALKETPEIQITTETPLEKIPKYSTETSISEETLIEKESTSEIAPRPLGIPGEGNCLVEGQSYSNNSAVPPANACQTSCRCISSIVQCELVQCPAPPAHLLNCMPVYTSGESCCPMYACDSTPTAELESDSHVIEPHTPEAEEDQKTSLPAEISTEEPAIEVTEAAKEYSTLAGEISTPEARPAEATVASISPSEEEIELTTEKQQTTLKSIEPIYEQPTTIAQSIEQQPEEHTISTVPEIAQESASQIPEEEHYTVLPNVPGEITEDKISEKEESITEPAASTEQPQEETIEEQTPVSGEEQIITSTHISTEQEIYSKAEEITTPTITEEKKISVPVEVEETSTSAEKEEEITTIGLGKEEEITTTTKENPSEEESVKEHSTPKSIKEGDTKQPEEEKILITSEKSIIDEEELSAKPEISEEQTTVETTEYESTSIPEIQPTTEHKLESETEHEEEKEHEIVTLAEGEQATQTEEPESQTKLPGIGSIETQEPIAPVAESTTLIHDHTVTEEAPLEEHATIKSTEVSTEESKGEIKPEFSTKVPEKEHVTIPISSVETEILSEMTTKQELEKSSEETAKPVEESTTEVSHEETSPETTESAAGKEPTEHAEEHTEPSEYEKEPSVTKLPEEKPSVTKLPEEKPSETESPISTEQPIKVETSKAEAEHEKPIEPSIVHEPESTQISTEQHPEVEIESHTSASPVEEHTIAEEILTTSVRTEEEAGEQPVTSKKEAQPSLDEVGTKQPIIPEAESEVPAIEEEHITVPIEEHTTKSEEHLGEEQTVIPSEGETTESGISKAEATESVTSQEEQTGTEKSTESAKPETELPSLTEEHTIISEIHKEEEEQKPEVGVTKETDKEEPVTEEAIKEEAVTSAGITEKYPAMEEHTEQEVEIKTHGPTELETTIAPKEQKPEEEVTSEPERPLSEEATTGPSLIPEEYPISVEAEEKEKGTHKPEYQTTVSIAEEEASKPVTEVSEVEKPEEEFATSESAKEKPEESITKVSVEISTTEKFAEVPSETEKPVPAVPEQETKSPEQQQGETTTKSTEHAVIEEKLPEEIIPVEVIPEAEEPSETSTVGEEEAHSTESSLSVETTSIHEEEHPSIPKLQPTEGPLPSEEETLAPGEIQPSKPEEGEEHLGIPEEPQFTTEHAPETSVTIKPEEHPETEQSEISSEAIVPVEGSTTISSVATKLPEEKATIGPISEEAETQGPIRPEEDVQETPIEDVIKTQPVSTELPIGESTEISDEEIVPSQESEEDSHPHIDHFPEATMKPETDYSAESGLGSDEEHLRPVNHTVESERPYHEHRPATTLAPHIPEYPDQSDEDYPHFPPQSGSNLNPDEDYDEDAHIYGPGTCRYGGKVYVSAQQIPRDDPCDFCFCFRSDIICLQQSCPPPIPGCHEEPISGFCCPRYECPVSMAMSLNLTTTTTTTTTTLPPHFHAHAYKGAAKRSGCQIRGQAYRVGEVIKSTSGPCLHCTCGGDGNMKCEPRMCSPEPMLRQMIATAAAKRRR
ncbi:titin isoform X1 [Formica exsecta]|uniref:titin isoform X1 n=1 Tax=Formica exsecta TaxID=72781 RepID=UPI0011443D16|nr:titin isoform X1 [Formica exsecta]